MAQGFTENEIIQGLWLKLSEHGQIFLLKFGPGGHAEESFLFNQDADTWSGLWTVQDGVLTLLVGQYFLNVDRSANGSIHRGVEVVISEGPEGPVASDYHTTFALVHLPDG